MQISEQTSTEILVGISGQGGSGVGEISAEHTHLLRV